MVIAVPLSFNVPIFEKVQSLKQTPLGDVIQA